VAGLDATLTMHLESKKRTHAAGLSDRSLPPGQRAGHPVPRRDLRRVWGEDAWCYITDKDRLIREAAACSKPGGTLAFTDWLQSPRRRRK